MDQTITLTLTPGQLQTIMQALEALPWRDANPIITAILLQQQQPPGRLSGGILPA